MEMAFTTLARAQLRLVICLHTKADPPTEAWEDMLRRLWSLLSAAPDTRQVRMLVVTGGGGPDAKQRAQLKDVWAERVIKVAVVVPGRGNPLKRGLMTALSWINPAMAFFTPEQFHAALAHLDQEAAFDEVWTQLAELEKQLGAVPTLRLIAQANALPLPSQG
jgi:hypothetical protein